MHSFYFMEYLFKCKYLLRFTVLGIIIHFRIRINIIKSYVASIDNLGNSWLLLVFWHIKEYFTTEPYTNIKEIVNNNSNYYYYHYYYHYDNNNNDNNNDKNNNSDNVWLLWLIFVVYSIQNGVADFQIDLNSTQKYTYIA